MARRGDKLTGGSGDVNPQYFRLRTTQTAADTFTITENQTPISRLRVAGRNKASVMEVLKILFFFSQNAAIAAVGETSISQGCALGTSTFVAAAAAPNNGSIFGFAEVQSNGAFTAGGTYRSSQRDPHVLDLTDGQGHGYLVATDSIFMSVASANTGIANTIDVWLLYRFKDISMTEYVGIVQSQQ